MRDGHPPLGHPEGEAGARQFRAWGVIIDTHETISLGVGELAAGQSRGRRRLPLG